MCAVSSASCRVFAVAARHALHILCAMLDRKQLLHCRPKAANIQDELLKSPPHHPIGYGCCMPAAAGYAACYPQTC